MTFEDFVIHLSKILAIPPNEGRELLKPETRLRDLATWDSISMVSFLIFLDTRHSVKASAQQIRQVETAGGLFELTQKR